MKFLMFLSTLIFLVCLDTTNLKAAEQTENGQVTIEEQSEKDLKVSDDTVLTFESVEAKEAYIEENDDLNPESNGSQVENSALRANGYFDELVATYKPNQVFGGYISSDWVKASSHTIKSGQSYNFSGSYQGIGLSFTYEQSTTSSLPADSSRYSKLAMYADYTIQKYKQNTPNLSTPNYFYKKSVRNSYVNVVYQ